MQEYPIPGLTPSAANASSYVLRTKAGGVWDFTVNTGAVAGWVMLHNRASAPANGAVTPQRVWQVPAYSTLDVSFDPPLDMSVGAVLTFSTTGPTTQTLSATAWFGGRVR